MSGPSVSKRAGQPRTFSFRNHPRLVRLLAGCGLLLAAGLGWWWFRPVNLSTAWAYVPADHVLVLQSTDLQREPFPAEAYQVDLSDWPLTRQAAYTLQPLHALGGLWDDRLHR